MLSILLIDMKFLTCLAVSAYSNVLRRFFRVELETAMVGSRPKGRVFELCLDKIQIFYYSRSQYAQQYVMPKSFKSCLTIRINEYRKII